MFLSYIPENTAVDVPIYTLFRDPRYFSPAPEEFRPARFLDASGAKASINGYQNGGVENGDEKPHSTDARTNFTAFIPFSLGPENCAGRALAMLELRVITTLVMRHFDLKFAKGYDPAAWIRDAEDWYVLKVAPLPVILETRVPVLD